MRTGVIKLVESRDLSTPRFWFPVSGFWFLVSWFRFPVSGFWFLVSCFRFPVSGFWFLVSGFWFLVSGFRFLVSGFWLLVSGFLVSGFWFLVSGFWFLVYGLNNTSKMTTLLRTKTLQQLSTPLLQVCTAARASRPPLSFAPVRNFISCEFGTSAFGKQN